MISDFRFHRCALSGVMKRFHQFGCAEHVCHTFYVVCHRCEADFDRAPDNPRIRRRGCPKMRYLMVAKGCSTVHRLSLITAGVTRSCIRFNTSSYKCRVCCASEPACSAVSGNMYRSRWPKPHKLCSDLFDGSSFGGASVTRADIGIDLGFVAKILAPEQSAVALVVNRAHNGDMR